MALFFPFLFSRGKEGEKGEKGGWKIDREKGKSRWKLTLHYGELPVQKPF